MRDSHTILFFCAVSVLLVPDLQAEVLQSAGQGGSLWATRDGAEIRIVQPGSDETRVQLPPGAFIHDLEPTADGWVAAGRLSTATGTDLLIVEGGRGGADLLPVPQRGSELYRGQPVLFLERRQLVGLAWAAGNGSQELEIWAAAWRKGEWGPAELVAAKGPGSQLAPAGAVLGDGSWLLVWTAFDGQDDEIVGSRRVGEGWTRPESIHPGNEVPDLTPDLVPIDGGALAVWSWFDGRDYRLKSSRWLDDGWHESQTFGARGSGEPLLMRTDDRVLLVYSSVVPASWTVEEMDRSGMKSRFARVPKDTYTRPLVLLRGDGDDVLRWEDDEQLLMWQDLP